MYHEYSHFYPAVASIFVPKKTELSSLEKFDFTNKISNICIDSKLFGDHRKANTSAYLKIIFTYKFTQHRNRE